MNSTSRALLIRRKIARLNLQAKKSVPSLVRVANPSRPKKLIVFVAHQTHSAS